MGANIAEGSGRIGHGEFCRFPQIATGSTSELEYHFLLARDFGLLGSEEHKELNTKVVEIRRMLCSLIKSVTSRGFRAGAIRKAEYRILDTDF